jgi:uncharacterized tellurite resistance protein B-like protein
MLTGLSELNAVDRLRLMKFICSFAWADLKIRPAERAFVTELVGRLDLSAEEEIQVHEWLEVPPQPEGLDPTSIPVEHRQAFLDAIEGVIEADGEVAEEERENLSIFKQLLS